MGAPPAPIRDAFSRASRATLLMVLLLALPSAGSAHGGKPPPSKPQLCPAGRYLVADGPLIPGAATPPDVVEIADDGSVSIASGCPAVASSRKVTREGTRVTAVWGKNTCSTLSGNPRLSALIEPTCASMTGKLKAKGLKRYFTAAVSGCEDGVDSPGETCPLLEGPAGDAALDHVHDHVEVEGVPESQIGVVDGLGPVARTQLEVGFELDATVGEVNAVLRARSARILATLEDVLLIVVGIPDPGSVEALEAIAAALLAEPAVASVRLAGFAEPSVLPSNYTPASNLSPIDHHFATRTPAAWNMRSLLPGFLFGPSVVVYDVFGNGAPGLDFDVFDVDTDYGVGAFHLHGYHVLGIIAGGFAGDTSPTGLVTGVFPTTLTLRAVDQQTRIGLTLADPTYEDLAIARMRTLLPGPIVLNTSLGRYCRVKAEPPPDATRRAACTAGQMVPWAVAWIEKVRGSTQKTVVGAGLENSFLHVTGAGNVLLELPGDFDARLGSSWTAASLLPGLTDAAGTAIPNLTNVIVVENAMHQAAPPYAPLCLAARSKRPGNLAAIGTRVWSMTNASGTAGDLNGTSMATPQVTGAAALVFDLLPRATPQQVASILESSAQPGLEPIAAVDCDPNTTSAPVLDVYAAVLATDVPGNAPVRRAILDQDGDQSFDEQDVEAFLDAFADEFGAFDGSRHDLNGDGYTGGDTQASFDLDIDSPPALENVSQDLGGSPRSFDETALRDLDVLCYYAWSDLYQGSLDERDRLLQVPCCADAGYTLTKLAPVQSLARAINDAGAVAVAGGTSSFRWVPNAGDPAHGSLQGLPPLAGYTSASADDIAPNGDVVGETSIFVPPNTALFTAVLWEGVVPRAVGPASNSSAAHGANASGVVAGLTGGVGSWVDDRGTITPIPGDGFVEAISDSGALAGNARTSTLFRYGPAFWPSAAAAPVVLASANVPGDAQDVSDAGLVVGYFRAPSVPFVYPVGGLLVQLPTLPEGDASGQGQAFGVNERGEIVGEVIVADRNQPIFERAVLWRNRVPIDLNTLVPPADAAEFLLARALDINERGQIVGYGYDLPIQSSSNNRAFLLTPTCGGD